MRGQSAHMSEWAEIAADAGLGLERTAVAVLVQDAPGPQRTGAAGTARGLLAALGMVLCLAAVARVHPAARAAPELVPSTAPGAPLAPAERRALLAAYAPTVLLAPGERALPASVDWYLARARLIAEQGETVVTAALDGGPRLLRPAPTARGGSPRPQDWTAYGHAYRAADGGVLLQYWFFYAFNDFHGVGDHEGDWEHVTVRLSRSGRPLGAWYARHDQNAPGVWFDWAALQREGDHPVVLSARGSHASYARPADVSWYDEACPTFHPGRAAGWACRVWRTWDGSAGGVTDLGTRAAPAARFVDWPGRWGSEGGLGDVGGGPPGPAYQEGWCTDGAPGCA